jgi:hypothetical protein
MSLRSLVCLLVGHARLPVVESRTVTWRCSYCKKEMA